MLGAEVGEFFTLTTAHLVATIEDLTDMLDYASEDIDDIDDDVDAEQSQNPPIKGRWTTTSTYDVYMVGTPEGKDDDGIQDPGKDKLVDEPPKRLHQRRRSRSRRAKVSNTGTGDNETQENAEDR